MNKRLVILSFLILSLILSSCSNSIDLNKDIPLEDERVKTEIVFSYMEGVTALTIAKMIHEDIQIGDKYNIKYEMLNSPDLLSTRVIKREADIGIIPTTLAAQSYNKDLGYIICGTSTWGNLYIVGKENLNSLKELKNKTIHTFGRGLTPDVIFKLILLNNSMDMNNDLNMVYLNSAAEVAPLIITNKSDYAILPEPILSNTLFKNPELKVLFSLNELWIDSVGVSRGYPQSSLVIKEELLESDPDFVIDFLSSLEDSINWALSNTETLGDLSESLNLGPPKDAIISGVDRLGINQFSIDDSMDEYTMYYSKILEFAPEFIGGKVPDEGIYYKAK